MIGRAAITQRDDGALVDPRSDADWLDWVPAGALRNWCANDLLVDWLNVATTSLRATTASSTSRGI